MTDFWPKIKVFFLHSKRPSYDRISGEGGNAWALDLEPVPSHPVPTSSGGTEFSVISLAQPSNFWDSVVCLFVSSFSKWNHSLTGSYPHHCRKYIGGRLDSSAIGPGWWGLEGEELMEVSYHTTLISVWIPWPWGLGRRGVEGEVSIIRSRRARCILLSHQTGPLFHYSDRTIYICQELTERATYIQYMHA